MTIYEALKQDHQKVAELLQKLQAGETDEQARQRLLSTLKQELEIHVGFEEEVFYPAVAETQEGQEIITDAIDEHDEAMAMIEELEEMDPASAEWREQVSALTEAITHHVEAEESEIFKIGQKKIEDQRAQQMAEQYRQRKQTQMKQSA